ncbi:hypothetical protein FCV25MIE_32422 [Fagus crenata]
MSAISTTQASVLPEHVLRLPRSNPPPLSSFSRGGYDRRDCVICGGLRGGLRGGSGSRVGFAWASRRLWVSRWGWVSGLAGVGVGWVSGWGWGGFRVGVGVGFGVLWGGCGVVAGWISGLAGVGVGWVLVACGGWQRWV